MPDTNMIEAVLIAGKHGEVKAVKNYSRNPSDAHRFVVLVVVRHEGTSLDRVEYVTWEVNAKGGCFAGNYFDRFDDAHADFNKRGTMPQ